MTAKFHAAAGTLALLLIATFWTATLWSELFGTDAQITFVKTAVLYGLAVMVPAMAAAGATGARLSRGWKLPLVARKQKRMALIAANGLLVLVPCAIFLATRAQDAQFDRLFFSVQGIELAAGALNATLLTLNLRDGLALARRRAA